MSTIARLPEPVESMGAASWKRRRGGRHRRGRARGQAAVELALSLPLLLMMFLVVVETGRAFYIAISVSNAARAGVQYGSQNLSTAADNAGMRAAAANDAPNIVGMTTTATHFCQCANGNASTCLSTDCAGSHRLLYTQVNTSAPYTPLVNFMGILPPITVPGKAIMRVVQ
ncbi:TadE/TadG family type IV pilus assembly protein [Candidatus Binatus sp.]|uniref:TadE/TadG family type IV pilus assembly protein n=1 Tax=Candidatus Binatus sp. TaxID=2811406 RepID=UPI002F951A6A